ncbi:MAG: hypothetical protein R2747_18505 [Pyrinomonadaceae bacterium]
MIKKLYAILAGFALLLIGGFTLTAQAQVPSNTVIKAHIPFSFIVKDKTFPAGEYTIKPTEDVSDSDMIFEIVRDNGREKAMIFETYDATENQALKDDMLIFDKMGDKYFLSKIFAAYETSGNEVEKSKMEKNLEDRAVKKETYHLKAKFWKKG